GRWAPAWLGGPPGCAKSSRRRRRNPPSPRQPVRSSRMLRCLPRAIEFTQREVVSDRDMDRMSFVHQGNGQRIAEEVVLLPQRIGPSDLDRAIRSKEFRQFLPYRHV